MLNFVICDDHVLGMNRLEKMLESIFISQNIDAQIGLKAVDAYSVLQYIEENHTDVLILDIDLKSNISGLELGTLIRKKNKSVYIIYTTGHIEYVLLAYKVKTFDYLPKPIIQEKLEETILRLIEDIKTTPKKYIKIGNNNYISPDDINFIKRDGMKLVFCANSRAYETYSSFVKIENCLPENFIRCHKSYIVNVDNISDIKSNENIIFFSKETRCDIGPKYKTNFMEVMKNYGNSANSLDSFNNAKRSIN